MATDRSSKQNKTKHRLPPYANQMWLVDFLSEYDRIKGGVIMQDYKNFIMLPPDQDSSLFLNEITAVDKGQSLIENVPRSLLGDLQPYFKLYVTEGMSTDNYYEYELPFNNFTALWDMKRSRAGLATGFRSFSWDYLGSHPGDIDYWINCRLVLYFESPTALFHEYTGEEGTPIAGKKYSFADLIYRRGPVLKGSSYATENRNLLGRGRDTHVEYNQRDHRIKIEIGYIPPKRERLLDAFVEQGLSGAGAIAAANDFKNALQENKVILYLTLVKHTFKPIFSSTDFSFEMDIEFVGSIEQAFLSDDANILIRNSAAFEKVNLKKEKAAAVLKAAAKQFRYLSPSAYQEVETYDLEIIRADTRKKGEKAQKTNLRDRVIKDLGIDTDRINLPGQGSGLRFDNDISGLYDALKKTSKVHQDEEKMLLSPVSKLDTYRQIICELNEKEKIYNSKFPAGKFRDYSNNRQSYLESSPMAPGELQKVKDKLEAHQQGRIKLSRTEEAETRRRLRQHTTSGGDLRKSFTELTEKAFGVGVNYSLEPAQRDKINKDYIRENQRKAVLAASASERMDVVAYNRYIQNSLGPHRGKKNARDTSKGIHFLYWFYYGDLLDAVLNVTKEFAGPDNLDIDLWTTENTKGVLKILLGNIEYVDHVTGEPKIINIAKVPISLKLWEEFWLKFVVTQLKDVYYLKSFLRDSLVYLVQASLTNRGRLPGDPIVTFEPGVEYLDIPNSIFKSKYNVQQKEDVDKSPLNQAYYLVRSGTSKKDLGTPSEQEQEATNKQPTERILYAFDMSNKPGTLISRDKERDNGYGVYHLVPGQYNSPLQQISFTKTDQPYWLEAKAFKAGHLQKNTHLSEPYNCNFTVYGNTLLRPGRHIYIRFPYSWFGSPSIDGSESRTLGLGGYFLMTKASNTLSLIANGGKLDWQTTVQCLWTTFGEETRPSSASTDIQPHVAAAPVVLEAEKEAPSAARVPGSASPFPAAAKLERSAAAKSGAPAATATKKKRPHPTTISPARSAESERLQAMVKKGTLLTAEEWRWLSTAIGHSREKIESALAPEK